MANEPSSIGETYHTTEIEALKCIRHIVDCLDDVEPGTARVWCEALEGFLTDLLVLKREYEREGVE